MLDVCRNKAEKEGIISRCSFHEGYLESLPSQDAFDAATCFLVSQFILESEARTDFFRTIAVGLCPGEFWRVRTWRQQ
ncbi:methyltransferase domain-containing protein [Polaromonas sp.]|uniref:methyltransferase domain-containing protein n=1 Tax=Polaromonas sp. TaxID=1869339 RepID=UPI0034539E5B